MFNPPAIFVELINWWLQPVNNVRGTFDINAVWLYFGDQQIPQIWLQLWVIMVGKLIQKFINTPHVINNVVKTYWLSLLMLCSKNNIYTININFHVAMFFRNFSHILFYILSWYTPDSYPHRQCHKFLKNLQIKNSY